jgi:di/tricarboxylate transporter
MTTSILPGRRSTAVLLVAASLLELTETVISPLADGSTSSAMEGIALHQAQFTISVLCGMTAVVLFGPGFLGLANVCAPMHPRLARFAGWVSAVAMTGFFGVRGIQAVQLAMVQDGLANPTAGKIVDDAGTNPLGVLVLVLFLGGALAGTIALAVATWRAGLPRVPAILLGVFQLVDLAAPGHGGSIVAHALLLTAMVWFATYLWVPRNWEHAEADGRPVESNLVA